jgi:imidazolonepropionase-like amidohydrolase/Tol biopolymer transport system component
MDTRLKSALPPSSVVVVAFLSLLCSARITAQKPDWRTIEFETTEVTGANVTVSPDGQWLIFTILGHLFRLPVEGGVAEQLRVAFISDRDGSEGNVFLLELEVGDITQLTHDPWAGRPAWSPDGQTIAYLSFVLDIGQSYAPSAAPAVVRRTPVSGGESPVVSGAPRMISSVVYLPDGRLAWSAFEGRPAWWLGGGTRPMRGATTRIEVLSENGQVSTLREVSGIVHRLVASPISDGLYGRKLPTPRMGGYYPEEEELVFLSLRADTEQHVASVWGTNGWDWGPRFDVAAGGGSLYVGDRGQLLEIDLATGSVGRVELRGKVELVVQDPVAPVEADLAEPGSGVPPRIVIQPAMSPDGEHLYFVAAGGIWVQPLSGGPARLIYEGEGFARDPVPSPDGRLLALVDLKVGIREVKLLDLESNEVRTLASGGDYFQPAWHPEGDSFTYADRNRARIVILDLNGEAQEIGPHLQGAWLSRPRFSSTGRALTYTSGGVFHRISLTEPATAEPAVPLIDPSATDSPVGTWVGSAVLSPDERWLAFRRGAEIWVIRADTPAIEAEQARLLSARGGHAFDFAPDGSAVIFADGNEVWRQPLASGEPERIALQVEVKCQTPPPALLRHVRVLDFVAGDFGPEVSMLVETGRIRWIGSESEHAIPEETEILDAAGRFAIPGLFDFHAHNRGGYQAPNNLAYGVTSLRDVGTTPLMWLNAFDDWSDATDAPIPRSFHAGEMVYGPPEILLTEEEARAVVRRNKVGGASLIKAYATLPWSIHRAVAEEARLVRLPMAAHGTTVKEVTKAVTLGYASLEHAGFRYYDDVLQMLAGSGTRWVPTVGNDMSHWLRIRAEPERTENEDFRAFVSRSRVQSELAAGDTVWKARMYPEIYAQETASIGAAFARGVKLLAGTDQQEHLAFPGVSLHWELEDLAEAGIPPLEVLRIATQESAIAVGAGDDLGTLEPGKLADIVLLDANPLEDIKNSLTIWRVIKGGWVFDPKKLRRPARGEGDQ